METIIEENESRFEGHAVNQKTKNINSKEHPANAAAKKRGKGEKKGKEDVNNDSRR